MTDASCRHGMNLASSASITIWFALTSGLVEGFSLLLLQNYGLLNRNALLWVSQEIIWISPMANMVMFLAVGLLLGLVRTLWVSVPFTGVFLFLTIYDWVTIAGGGYIRHYAIFLLSLGFTITLMNRFWNGNELVIADFFRRSCPWLAGIVIVLFISIQGHYRFEEHKAEQSLSTSKLSPNVVIIIMDALRADHLSTYNYPRKTSPNLDNIAKQGVLFENAIATSSWSLPSHTSLLTGRYGYEHGANRMDSVFDGKYPTIAEFMRGLGFRTAAFSANPTFFSRTVGLGRGFIRFEDHFSSIPDMWLRTSFGREFFAWGGRFGLLHDFPGRKRAADVRSAFLSWIDRGQSRPYFAVLNLFDTHAPYLSEEPYRKKFFPGNLDNSAAEESARQLGIPLLQLYDQINTYDDAIAYIDNEVKNLVDGISQRPGGDNTLIVFTSDHGESLGEHGLVEHRYALYRELIHVPLIFWWPGRIPGNLRVEQAVSLAALPATLANLVGEPKSPFRGPSLDELWKGSRSHAAAWSYALSELARMAPEPGRKGPAFQGSSKSLVSNQWHYIIHETLGAELYDWESDPEERNNLAFTPAGRTVVARFDQYLKAMPSN